MIGMGESSQTTLVGIKILSMDLLFSWPSSQRFWTVDDFSTGNDNLWKPAQTRGFSQWTGMTFSYFKTDTIVINMQHAYVTT